MLHSPSLPNASVSAEECGLQQQASSSSHIDLLNRYHRSSSTMQTTSTSTTSTFAATSSMYSSFPVCCSSCCSLLVETAATGWGGGRSRGGGEELLRFPVTTSFRQASSRGRGLAHDDPKSLDVELSNLISVYLMFVCSRHLCKDVGRAVRVVFRELLSMRASRQGTIANSGRVRSLGEFLIHNLGVDSVDA